MSRPARHRTSTSRASGLAAALVAVAALGSCGPEATAPDTGAAPPAAGERRAPRVRAESGGPAPAETEERRSPDAEAWVRDLVGEDQGVANRALLRIHQAKDPRIARRLAALATDAAHGGRARYAALEGLLACGSAASAEAGAVGRLLDGSDFVARRAAEGLPRLGPAGLEELIAALGPDRPHGAHRNALSSLTWGAGKHAAAVPAVVRVLRECPPAAEEMPRTDRERERSRVADEDRCTCRENAAAALGGIGVATRDALDALAAALEHDDRGVREKAAEALGKLGPEGVTMLVARLPHATDWYTAHAIACALADTPLDRADVVAALIDASRRTDTSWHAVRGLAKLRTPEAAAVMRAHVRDGHWKTRRVAMQTLAEMGDLAHDAIPDMRALLDSAEEDTGEHAVPALDKLGALMRDDLDRALRSPNAGTRGAATVVAARTASVADLLAWASDPKDERCGAAVVALGTHPDSAAAAVPVLVTRARSGDDRFDRAAAEALGALGPAAAPALAALCDDPACSVSEWRLLPALAATRWPGATAVFVRRLCTGTDVDEGHEAPPAPAAELLVATGGVPRGDEPELRRALQRRHPIVATAGAVGLVRSGVALDDAETRDVIRALSGGWSSFEGESESEGESGSPAAVEMLRMLGRFGARAAPALPDLRDALAVQRKGVTRDALAAAIAAIEAAERGAGAPPPDGSK